MTPKTLDKYIAALKKKAAAGGWSVDQYQAELDKIKDEMAQQYLDNKMTGEEYTKVSKQLENAEKNPGLLGKSLNAPAAQTSSGKKVAAPKISLQEAMDKKKAEIIKAYDNGQMTLDENAKLYNSVFEAKTVEEVEAIKVPSGKKIKYSDLYDQLVDVSDEKISADDAMKLTDMVSYLEKSKMDPLEAKKKMEEAISLIEHGAVAEKAMEDAAGYQEGAKAKAQTKKAITDDDSLKLTNMLMDKVTAGEMSFDEFSEKQNKVIQMLAQGAALDDVKSAVGLNSAPKAPGMTHDEYIGLWEQLNAKKKAGLITKEEHAALGNKLDAHYNKKTPLLDVEKEIGLDPGSKAADEAVIKLGKEFKKVYKQAADDMQKKLDDWTAKFSDQLTEFQAKVAAGEMSQADFQSWMNRQKMMSEILKAKIDQASGIMLNANKKALGLVNGQQVSVFAENANYQSYQLVQEAKVNLMFAIYDEATADKLLKDKPELLPRKVVDGKKDKAWNQKIMASAVLRSVIEGESIPTLARRIATMTGETNMKAMVRYARTAMTAAQNCGRMETLHRAQGMGIKCKKRWLSTLDSRTRDAHRSLDGQTVGIDEPFMSDLGKIMFPGDPAAAPGNVYNCRCTLVYEYDDFPNDPTDNMRRDNETGQLITDMNYDEWHSAKENSKLNDLNLAKIHLAEVQKDCLKKRVSETKVYKDLWKEDVKLADYPDKKDSIQAKRDYYTSEIEKYNQAKAEGKSWATDEKIDALVKKRKLLDEFEKHGELLVERNKALQAVQDIYNEVGLAKTAQANVAKAAAIKKGKSTANAASEATNAPGMSLGAAGEKKTPFGPDAYTQERKNKALWTTDRKKVDSMMRGRTGEVWQKATEAERDAIYEYTQSYSKYNEPLRGIEYGTNRYLGVGNTDLNARNNGRRLNLMTDIIDRCSYDHDQWFQRGCGWRGMDKFFGVSESLLRNGTDAQLKKALLGTTPTEYGFMSMGSAKGKGFSGNVLLNIYAPAGTRMMYVEPFSAYSGSYEHMDWDGKSGQSNFGGEFETIMQQGTQFRVTKVERKNGKVFIDMEVINQDNQQRWKR